MLQTYYFLTNGRKYKQVRFDINVFYHSIFNKKMFFIIKILTQVLFSDIIKQ